MDSGGTPAERPVTLDITVEDVSKEVPAPASPEPCSSQTASKENVLPLVEESIDLGGEFATPQEDSSATPSESLMDRLNDQMMESVMISDSPNNSEEDDVAAMDSFLDAEEGERSKTENSGGKEEQAEIGQDTNEIMVSLEEKDKDTSEENAEEDLTKDMDCQQDDIVSTFFLGDTENTSAAENKEQVSVAVTTASPKDEPVPVCTIFSQGTQPKSLVPDGFQPTLIKSPSFGMGSGGGSDEAGTPSKLHVPLICQPSPSLSKFFTENGQTNPASDFFDSFTVPSSFISVSNPNAELPSSSSAAPTPERQLSSTSSSISTPGATLDFVTPSSVFAPGPIDSSSKTQSTALQTAHASTAAPSQPFNQLQAVFSGSDDPFATALSLSEVDRRHDAWLPSDETRKVLISVATQQYSPAYVETSRLTMPGLKFDNLQVRRGDWY